MMALRLVVSGFGLFLAVAGAVRAEPEPSRRTALVIGNASYQDSEAPLTAAIEGARSLAEEFKRQGFETELATNLDRRGLVAATDRFLASIRPGTTALIYYSGLALQSGRRNFLIPTDAQIWTEADVASAGLPLNWMVGELGRRGAQKSFVILDAAYRNGFERRFRSFSTGLAPILSPHPGTAIIFSAAPGVSVKRDVGSRNPFATELVRKLGETKGVSEALFERVAAATAEATQNGQAPWISSPAQLAAGAGRPGANDAERRARDGRSKPDQEVASRPANELRTSERTAIGAGKAAAGGEQNRVAASGQDKGIESPSGNVSSTAERAATVARQGQDNPVQQPSSLASNAPLAKPEPARLAPLVLPYSAEDNKLRAELTAALQRDPADPAALSTRGQLYALHRDFTLALADFDALVRVRPSAEALNNRCWVRAILDELDGALADCEAALKERPNFVDALDSRGFTFLKIGQPQRAIADFEAVLQVNRKQASALYGRGVALVRLGRKAAGANDIKAALAIEPKIAEDFAAFGVKA